jgi:hypothetical protein
MMSTFQALALILGTMAFGIHVIMGISKMVESTSLVIVTGVHKGLPLSTEYRWMMLWNFYTPTLLTGAALAAGGAFALAQVGKNVADPTVRTLAFVCAGGASLSSLLWVLGGINGVLYIASVLRKATRN